MVLEESLPDEPRMKPAERSVPPAVVDVVGGSCVVHLVIVHAVDVGDELDCGIKFGLELPVFTVRPAIIGRAVIVVVGGDGDVDGRALRLLLPGDTVDCGREDRCERGGFVFLAIKGDVQVILLGGIEDGGLDIVDSFALIDDVREAKAVIAGYVERCVGYFAAFVPVLIHADAAAEPNGGDTRGDGGIDHQDAGHGYTCAGFEAVDAGDG